jgi:hypothetical protein
MKTTYTAAIVLALATLVTGQAMARIIPSEAKETVTGVTFRELSTGVQAAKSGLSSKTRAEVRTEVLDVRKHTDGRDNQDSLTGLTYRELSEGAAAAKTGVSSQTRAQVRAVAVTAQRSRDGRDLVEPNTGLTYRELSGS